MKWTKRIQRMLHHGVFRQFIPFLVSVWQGTITVLGTVLVLPFSWLFGGRGRRKTSDLLYGIPGMLAVIGAPFLFSQIQAQQRTLDTEYLSAARTAVARKQYPQAKVLLDRLLRMEDSKRTEARFLMALVFDNTGQTERALRLYEALAPTDRVGNRDAHRQLAMIRSAQVSTESSIDELRELFWHLTSAGRDESPTFALAWGKYYLAVGDLAAARSYLEKAVEEFPELWQTLGLIELEAGNNPAAVARFERSANYLSEQLQADPSARQIRIDYARTLMQLGRFNEAQVIFEQGLKVDPDGPWPFMMASLVISIHDLRATQQAPLSELLSLVNRALTYEPNHSPALNRLMSYARAKVEGNASLKEILARVLAEGEEPALAHLAMGNLCWLEGDREQANFHIEQALSYRKDMPVILNNLAWLIAHDAESPDPDRAMELVSAALEVDPENRSFLDTRGTIYFLKEDWQSALRDLEKSLPSMKGKNKAESHGKLAKIYEELGHKEIAKQHRLLMESSASDQTAPLTGN